MCHPESKAVPTSWLDKMSKKKIVFEEDEKRHADLKIKLKHYGISQSNFLRACISGLINDDVQFIKYFNKVIDEYTYIKSKKKTQDSKKLLDKGLKQIGDFGFVEGEIENIFDLIEKEHPDL